MKKNHGSKRKVVRIFLSALLLAGKEEKCPRSSIKLSQDGACLFSLH
jgi:hypothetical protein